MTCPLYCKYQNERGIREFMGKENVHRLQEVLKQEGIDYYIIPIIIKANMLESILRQDNM